MNDYISRDALLEKIDGIWDCNDMVFEPDDHCCGTDDCGSCKWWQTKNAIRKIAAAIPAADVRPVVKAVWEDGNKSVRTSGHLFNWWCSRCGNPQHTPVAKTLVEFTIDNPYCHKCGADMREQGAEGGA